MGETTKTPNLSLVLFPLHYAISLLLVFTTNRNLLVLFACVSWNKVVSPYKDWKSLLRLETMSFTSLIFSQQIRSTQKKIFVVLKFKILKSFDSSTVPCTWWVHSRYFENTSWLISWVKDKHTLRHPFIPSAKILFISHHLGAGGTQIMTCTWGIWGFSEDEYAHFTTIQ